MAKDGELKIRIRQACEDDIEDLLALAAFADRDDGGDREEQISRDTLRQSLFMPGSLCRALVADASGPIVGVAHYHRFQPAVVRNPTLALDDLYVIEQYRRLGIGWKLLEELSRRAIEMDCEQIDFTVQRGNRKAVRFYKRLGAKVYNDTHYCRLDRKVVKTLASSGKEGLAKEEEPKPKRKFGRKAKK